MPSLFDIPKDRPNNALVNRHDSWMRWLVLPALLGALVMSPCGMTAVIQHDHGHGPHVHLQRAVVIHGFDHDQAVRADHLDAEHRHADHEPDHHESAGHTMESSPALWTIISPAAITAQTPAMIDWELHAAFAAAWFLIPAEAAPPPPAWSSPPEPTADSPIEILLRSSHALLI